MVVERAPDGCWQISPAAEERTLLLKFVGPTPTAEFSEFLRALTAYMPEADATLVFDLTELDGYNPATKQPMKAWLSSHKLAIRELVVVVQKSKAMLRMATAAIGLAVGLKITIRERAVDAEATKSAAS
jgi:hypothetical protein